ncbi:hypothetical protein J3A83DRAFT_4191195 [Scleroderma citrinum]
MEIPACLIDYATPPFSWTSLGHQSFLQLNHPKQEMDSIISKKAKTVVDLTGQEDLELGSTEDHKSSLNKKPLIPESPSKKKTPTSENSSLEAIHHIKEVGKQAHLQAEKTWKAYDGHICWGHEWLQSHTKSSSTIPTSIVNDIYNDPAFKDAFEKLPNHCSDKALALYLSWRGFHEN